MFVTKRFSCFFEGLGLESVSDLWGDLGGVRTGLCLTTTGLATTVSYFIIGFLPSSQSNGLDI